MGAANGMFSIAAIASMMRLAGHGRERREGTRVGLWGAAQAMAFGLGGLAGAAASDVARWWIADVGLAVRGGRSPRVAGLAPGARFRAG
jgi:BCD family chlorophyll transporter-like MFS transporter